MNRREFIMLLGGTAAAWPLAARAQQPAMPVIGFVRITTPGDSAPFLAAFKRGLGESGYVQGQNVAIEDRYAFNEVDRLPALMAELVGRRVAVLAATGGTISARAAKSATSTIPIVFTIGDDPVKVGLVASLNKPGGNLTGLSVFSNRLGSKRLGLLHEMVPTASPIAILVNPTNPEARTDTRGEASLRGHLKAEGDEQTGSQSYIPPDPKDDKALHTALDLIRGIQKNSAYPPNPKTAVPN